MAHLHPIVADGRLMISKRSCRCKKYEVKVAKLVSLTAPSLYIPYIAVDVVLISIASYYMPMRGALCGMSRRPSWLLPTFASYCVPPPGLKFVRLLLLFDTRSSRR